MASVAVFVSAVLASCLWLAGDVSSTLPLAPAQGPLGTPVTIVGPDSAFAFKAPAGLLGPMQLREGTYPAVSVIEWPVRGSGASLRMTLLSTSWDDEDQRGIYSFSNFDRYFVAGRKPTFRTKTKAGRLVASGFLGDGRIFYRQGDYTEMLSMRGRETGAPQWVWSRSWVIEFVYPEERRAEFDTIVPMVTRSLTANIVW